MKTRIIKESISEPSKFKGKLFNLALRVQACADADEIDAGPYLVDESFTVLHKAAIDRVSMDEDEKITTGISPLSDAECWAITKAVIKIKAQDIIDDYESSVMAAVDSKLETELAGITLTTKGA